MGAVSRCAPSTQQCEFMLAFSTKLCFPLQQLMNESEDKTIYKVVVNHEEQYSIWPAHKQNALGWRDAGKSGTKAECLAHIKEVWTDMRPLSLRRKMEEAARKA